MDAINHNPSIYPLNDSPYVEVKAPCWDVATKVISVASTPLKIPFWIYSYGMTSSEQYQKKEPPGAQGHAVLGSYLDLRARNFRLLNFLTDYNQEFGQEKGICKLNFGTRTFYIVTKPEYVKSILQQPSSFVRGESLRIWRKKFSPGGLSEGEETQKFRMQAESVIGHSELPFYFARMKSISHQWMSWLEPYAEQGKPFDLFYAAEGVALATVGETLFKDESNELATNPFALTEENSELCTKFLNAYHTIFELITNRMVSGLANIPVAGDTIYSSYYADEEKQLTDAKNALKEVLGPIFKDILEGKIDKKFSLL